MGWTVLCVSKISPAQITRNMILERAGYQIFAIDDPDEALRIFKTSAVDAVVFGDSVNGEQRFHLARTFKSLNGAVPIVALSGTSGSQLPTRLIDQQLESLGDPHLLLEALKRVLPQDGNGSAQSALDHNHPGAMRDRNDARDEASSLDDDGASAKISPMTSKKSAF
jgi:DNA-binding NtrC family response regulator